MSWETTRAIDLTPDAIQTWREAHGWDRPSVARVLGVSDGLIGMYERGERRPTAALAAYIAAHPAPLAVNRYPATTDGLLAAIGADWPHKCAWCQWWGTSEVSLYRWLAGEFELPVEVRAWLRAGAPREWQRTPAQWTAPGPRRLTPEQHATAQFRTWRLGTGYRRVTIARLFGVNRQTIANWEAGRHRVPKRVLTYLRREGAVPAALPVRRPTQHHEPPCAPGTCRSCGTRRRWQREAIPRRPDSWTDDQDARLRALVGNHSPEEISARLTAEFGIPRTLDSIRSRACVLGVPSEWDAFTVPTIARICGVGADTVYDWIRAGGLVAVQRHRGAYHRITAEAFEQFIRCYSHWLDWRGMPVAQEPWRIAERRWRDLAEAVWRKDPWYTPTEAARWLGYVPSMVTKLCQRGQLRAELGPNGRGWRIPRSALVAFAQTRRRRQSSRRSA